MAPGTTLGLLAVLAMSAVPGAQATPSSGDVIVWSGARKLDWKDFKAKPPPARLEGALSAISHEYAVGCREQVLQMRVQTIFLPEKSWVAYRISSSGLASRAGIKHEQAHFDLAEVYARRMRKMFRDLRDPCGKSDEELVDMAEQLIKEHWKEQRRFDLESENGQLQDKQNDWERRVAAELAALAAFASLDTVDAEERSNGDQDWGARCIPIQELRYTVTPVSPCPCSLMPI